jgi:hypothetical protein
MLMARPKRLSIAAVATAGTVLSFFVLSNATGASNAPVAVSKAQLDIDADNSQAIGQTMDTFAGLYVSGSTIYVGVTKDTPAIESQIEDGANPAEYQFSTRPNSWKTLLKLQETFMSQASSAGLQVSEVWPDPKTDTLGVGLVTVPSGAQQTVSSLLGSDAITLSQIPLDGGEPLAATRADDSSPWNGGDFISTSKTSATCSSGPPVTGDQTGNDYVLTAGHCFSIGDIVHNYDAYAGVGGYGKVGEVNFGNYNNENAGDVHLVLTSGYGGSSSLDFTGSGGPNDSTKTTLDNGRDPAVGTNVCGDGAFDGLHCGGDVKKILVCKTYNDGTTHCGEDKAVNDTNYLAGNGDSGGPVTGPQAHTAYGTVAYGAGTTYVCNKASAGRTCYGTLWFESMGYIQRFYGVTAK